MTCTVRPRPCPTCPYRRNVASGVWAAEEYQRLRKYDGEIADQAMAGAVSAFGCHLDDGQLCAGWVGHRDPADLLALRIASIDGRVDDSVFEYRTGVPLWPSGAEAAAHGLARVEAPDEDAAAAIHKILRTRRARGTTTPPPHREGDQPDGDDQD